MQTDPNETTFIERTMTVPTGGWFGTTVKIKFRQCGRCAALIARDARQQHATFHARLGR